MAYENVIVNAAEARDAANQIENAIQRMQDGVDKLNQEMEMLHRNTTTKWEEEFNADWNNYYKNKFPTVVAALRGQVQNLRTAATAADQLDR